MSDLEANWQALMGELDAWAAAGRCATLWWRDDDAIAPTGALDRMLALAERHRVPLGLAVIPASATPALSAHLEAERLVDVLQHGFVHQNHAGAGERAAEFGPQRTLASRLDDAARGWRMLEGFSRRTPIFVPPWNRYDPDIAAGLAGHGIVAISAFSAARRLPAPMVECNCHIDIISWRTTRGFAGVEKTLRKLGGHLRDRRTGIVPAVEATGLLSHHLVHDAGCWSFLSELFTRLDGHPAVQWLRPLDAVEALERS